MTLDTLFGKRILLAEELKDCIQDAGYTFTKVFISKKTDISRPTLDRLLNGTIDNKSTFEKHLQKILVALDKTADELLSYSSVTEVKNRGGIFLKRTK